MTSPFCSPAFSAGLFFSTLLTFFVVPATYVAIEGFRQEAPAREESAGAAVPAVDGA